MVIRFGNKYVEQVDLGGILSRKILKDHSPVNQTISVFQQFHSSMKILSGLKSLTIVKLI